VLKKSVAVLSSLLLTVVGLVGISTPAHAANIVLDMSGQSVKFNALTTPVPTVSGSATTYKNVATVSGIKMDAVVTTTLTNAGSLTLDVSATDRNAAIAAWPAGSAAPMNTPEDLLQTNISTTAANGYVDLNVKFYESGTYTGPGTGNLITVKNLTVNSYDLDSPSGHQFTEFSGFQTYSLSASPATTTVSVVTSGVSAGYVRFLDISAANTNYSDTNGSYTKGRVLVTYNQLTELSVRHGVDINSGSGRFALDFGPGYQWKDSAVRTTTTNANPNNSAPTTANKTINYSSGTPWVFSLESTPTTQIAAPNNYFDFPYADAENNAFASVKIVSLPAAGTLQLLVGSTWTNVTVGQDIPASSINQKMLRYTGTTDSSFLFKVYDGQALSAQATMTLKVAATAQTINFSNPGTKNLANGQFASGATATSGLTVILYSLTPATCTVSGLNIVPVANGVCTIIATQPGSLVSSPTYAQAQPVKQSFTISTLTAQTITLATPSTKAVNTTLVTAPTASSGLTVTLVSLTTDICTVSTFTVTHVAEGYCILYATQAGNGTYAAASPVEVTYLVNAGAKTAQTITLVKPNNVNSAAGTITLSPTASSGLTVALTTSTRPLVYEPFVSL